LLRRIDDGTRAKYDLLMLQKGKMRLQEPLVISASRRTDLVGCYPGELMDRLRQLPPERVHTLVVWTKNPSNMIIGGALRRILKGYRNIYVHLTITGMGGGSFEPGIPPWRKVAAMIGPLIELVESPERLCWRFDPILEAEGHGRRYSNLGLFPVLVEAIAPFGIRTCRVSWVSPYKKVVARMGGKGWRLLASSPGVRSAQARRLSQVARVHGMELHFCSMEGFPVSRCIDGHLLSQIHPDGLRCSQEKARGQRPLCGCTESLDIGWYTLRCLHGCLYCYACP